MKALIIDDEKDICFLLSSILKQNSFETNYVNNLTDAYGALEASSPCIIFLDNHLPDGLGVDFISHIKKTHPEAKIVMITAHDTSNDKIKALQNGANVFIGKPFTRDIIVAAIKAVS